MKNVLLKMNEKELACYLISTRKIRKITYVSVQNYRDHEEISSRMRTIGVKIDLVTEVLENFNGGKVTVERLLKFARKISKKTKIKIDRLAYRNRNALLCWYAENWDSIYPYLEDFNLYKKQNSSSIFHKEKILKDEKFVDPSDIAQLLNYH